VKGFWAVILSVLMGCASTPPAATKTAFSVQKDVVYQPQDATHPEALLADVYVPSTSTHRAALLLVHGGGWRGPDRRSQMNSLAKRLAERGYVVMNATYRFAPQHRYPAPIDDLETAVRFLRSQAAIYGFDGQKIGAFGYSAGGHLVAQLGALNKVGLKAIVAGAAPADLALYDNSPLVNDFLGGTPQQVPAVYATASPVQQVSADDPPVFMYHGTWDQIVPPEHTRRYQAALQKAGVTNEVFWLNGHGHISAFYADGAAVEAALGFLGRVFEPSTEPSKKD
jgi:acetyl esterase/lipase